MQVLDYNEAIFASELKSTEKLTALIIGSYYNWKEQSMCWPSNKTLAKATGLSISCIVKAKKQLVLGGYLEVWRRIDNSNMYRPLIPKSMSKVLHQTGSDSLTQRVYSETPTNNEYNNEVNNEYNNEKNQTSFDKSINQIPTDSIIDISPVAFVTGNGTALKEQAPAENYIPESLRERAKIWD